jgi:trk system potassium uptake protein TrkH
VSGQDERDDAFEPLPEYDDAALHVHEPLHVHKPLGGYEPRELQVRLKTRRRRVPHPAQVLLLGFAALIAVGTVLLMLPISSSHGTWTGPSTALFTATSAVCVTGLVVVDTGTHWSPVGELLIIALVQVGGFGFMTRSTMLLLLLVRRRTSLRDRILVSESMGNPGLGGVTNLIRNIGIFTLLAEAVGAVILTLRFAAGGEAAAAGSNPLWWGIFHSISAFNNGGFDLTGGFQSVVPFGSDVIILSTLGVLVMLGSLGYAIVSDVVAKRRWRRLALETKVVLATTAALFLGGALVMGAIEWNNVRTLGAMSAPDRVMNAAFESVMVRSGGFSTFDQNAFAEPALFVAIALMFIGGASGSTGGGIKINTFSVLLVAIIATIRGRPSAEAFGRRILHVVVYRALTVALLAIAFVFVVAFALLLLMSEMQFEQALFEAVSAFGTVGLSTGVTPSLSDPARLVLVLAMFAGRLGPLTLVLALAARARTAHTRPAVESIRIG